MLPPASKQASCDRSSLPNAADPTGSSCWEQHVGSSEMHHRAANSKQAGCPATSPAHLCETRRREVDVLRILRRAFTQTCGQQQDAMELRLTMKCAGRVGANRRVSLFCAERRTDVASSRLVVQFQLQFDGASDTCDLGRTRQRASHSIRSLVKQRHELPCLPSSSKVACAAAPG